MVDPDLDRARRTAEAFGSADHTDDYESVLADDSIDVVDLCTPPTLHGDQVRAAVRAGKHVLLEKPVSTTLQDAEHTAQVVAASDRTVMVAENWVFSSAGRCLKTLVDSGSLGEVFLWTSRHESDHRLASGRQPAWNFDLTSSGGGYLTQAGTHAISLGRQLFGEVESVTATSPQACGDGGPFLDHDLVATLEFRSGLRGSLVLTGRSHRSGPRVLAQSVFGTHGTVDADIFTGRVERDGLPLAVPAPTSLGFDEEFDHFFACVRDGSEPIVSPANQVETLRTVAALYRAAATGSSVTVGTTR